MDNQNYQTKRMVIICGGPLDGATHTIGSAAKYSSLLLTLRANSYRKTVMARATYHFVEVEVWEKDE